MKEPEFYWDEELGMSACYLTYKNETFAGFAECAEQDLDMKSEKTGAFISHSRARIQVLKFMLAHELKPLYDNYKQLYTNMETSKKFNPKSYEARSIRKQMYKIKNDILLTKEMIKEEKDELATFIDNKEKMYQKVRKMREDKQN